MWRTIAGWVGTFMTTLAVALGQQYWYGSSSSHTPTAFWNMIECLVIASVCSIFWFVTSHGKPSAETAKTTSGDNSPIGGSGDRSMTAGRDNKQINAGTYYEAAAPPPPPPPQAKPRIAISAPELCTVFWNRAMWQRGEKGVVGAIVWIHNLAADEGGSRGIADSVSVSLNFKQRGNTVAHLSSAYWIDHIENARDLGVDARFAVLIATFYGSTALKVCNNTRGADESVYLSQPRPSDKLKSLPILREEIIPATSVIEIKAAVLSKGKTLADRTFNCVKNADDSLTIV